MLKIEKFIVNPWQENTYLLYDETKEAAIVDCGCLEEAEQRMLLDRIKILDLTITKLLQTHLHLDHIFGYPFTAKTFGLKAYAHKDDEFLLDNFQNQAQRFGIPITTEQPELGFYIDENDTITIGKSKLLCIHVPGHSPGGICFYNEEDKILLSGDCLFQNSIGRTDLERGDHSSLIINLQQKILPLPENVEVYPGHGPTTSVGFEKTHNPFL